MAFRPGQSGNPRGRPKGALNQSRLRETIAKDLPEILKALATAAKGGDVHAAKLLLDRTVPALRPIDSPAPLPLGADLAGASAAVLAALANGSATPDQAAGLASVLASLARVKEMTELEQRIANLENRVHETAPNPSSSLGDPGRSRPGNRPGPVPRAGTGGA